MIRFAGEVLQWLSFEQTNVQSSMGRLRYWTLTGKLPARPRSLIDGQASNRDSRSFDILIASCPPSRLSGCLFIADISLFADAHWAGDAVSPRASPAAKRWVRARARSTRFLAEMYPYPRSSLTKEFAQQEAKKTAKKKWGGVVERRE